MPKVLIRFALFVAALCGMAGPAAAADLDLSVASGHVIDVRINGQPVRLRVDPETSGFIILNGEAAQRIGLRASMIGAQTAIGPVRVSGRTKVARVAIGATEGRRRLIWTDRVAAAGADGLIGPADMPFDRVTLRLREPTPGERSLSLPMQYDRSHGLFHMFNAGVQPVRMRISTIRRDSLSTAAAGALLAEQNGGAWSGEGGEQMIKYGVVRPVRPLTLARPAQIGGLALSRFLVRTSDNRGNASLPADQAADPDEIVVTAQSGRQRARYDLSVGLDWLAGCSSLIWDNRARVMTLSCV